MDLQEGVNQLFGVRGHLKCDGTRAESRFRLSAKWTSPFKSAGVSVQSTTGSQGVRISGNNAGYTMFRGSVKSTGYPLHSPVSPSLPLPCVTVCHHISTGVYHRDIILCDMLHYSSIRSFCDMAGSTAIAAVPAYRKQGSTHTLFQCTVVNITFPITTVKNALEMVSFAQGTHQHMTDMFTAHLSAPVEYEECSLSGNDYSYVLYPFTSPTSKKSRHRFRAGE